MQWVIVLEEGSLIKVFVQTGIQVCDGSAGSLWKRHYCAYSSKAFLCALFFLIEIRFMNITATDQDIFKSKRLVSFIRHVSTVLHWLPADAQGWKRAAECYREISVFYCMDVEGGVGLGWFQCAGHGAALHPKQLQEFWMRSKEVFLSCRVLTSNRATIRASQPHAAALWVPLEGPLGSKTFVSVRVSMASSLRRRWGSGTCKSQKLKKQESRISDPEATNYTEGDGCDFSLTQFPSPTFTGDTCVLWAWILPEQDGNGNSSNRDLSWNGQRFWQAVKLYLGGGETGRWKEESELGSSYLFFLHPVIQSEFSRI